MYLTWVASAFQQAKVNINTSTVVLKFSGMALPVVIGIFVSD